MLPYEIEAHKSNDFSRAGRALEKAAATAPHGPGSDAGPGGAGKLALCGIVWQLIFFINDGLENKVQPAQ